MQYIRKQLTKGLGLLLIAPLAGIYTLLSKHWILNSILGLALASTFIVPLNPILVFATGYILSAAVVSIAQQIFAFAFNFSINQCEMMAAPVVPEISYAAYKGLKMANKIAAVAESNYQNKPTEDITEDHMFYGRKSANILFYSAGHFRCAAKGCGFGTWEGKEQAARNSHC